jgi:shikimate kinase
MKGKVPERITLIGFMGSGKTSVGQDLALLLGMRLIDLDRAIEQREGSSINAIFDAKGEAYFREREREALEAAAAAADPVVVCSGGGIVLDPRNVAVIRRKGVSVWLKAQPETVYARIKEEGTRPILNDGMSMAKIVSILEKRLPLYEAAADFAVETDGKNIREIAREIIGRLRRIA